MEVRHPVEVAPAWVQFVLKINPLTQLVSAYRAVLLDGKLPEALPFLYLVAFSLLVFAMGFAVFDKLKADLPDLV